MATAPPSVDMSDKEPEAEDGEPIICDEVYFYFFIKLLRFRVDLANPFRFELDFSSFLAWYSLNSYFKFQNKNQIDCDESETGEATTSGPIIRDVN